MEGVPCPRYIRSMSFSNAGADGVSVFATFQSGATQTYPILSLGVTNVEKDIQHDTWTEVDPIVSFSVNVNGKITLFNDPATSIEIRTYGIASDGSITRQG